jgi:proline iminopeptidase
VKAAAANAEIHFVTRGSGPACLIPSSIGTAPYERQMPARLSERLQLVFVDLRGSGQSTGDPSELTFEMLADDLEAVRTALGREQVAVLGHSVLGLAAIEYGRRRPASVSHVIAVGAPPRGEMGWLMEQGRAFFEADASEERKAALRRNLAALAPGAPPSEAVLAQTPMRFFDAATDAAPLFAGAQPSPALLGHLLGRLAPGWDAATAAGELSVPLLLALGRYDYVVPHRLWDDIAPRLSGATVALFERSGHQPFVEEPERFADVVTGWLARRG